MQLITILFSSAAGYLIGALNPAYLLGRMQGIDIRKTGTHNAGTTNALLTLGICRGILVFLFDTLKMFLMLQLISHLFPARAGVLYFTGLSVLSGHCYPFYMHFRGGKGIASYFGMVLFACSYPIIFLSFFVYIGSSLFLFYILKKRKYINAIGALIGTLYFFNLPAPEYKYMGITAGILLCLCNIQKIKTEQ